MMGSLLWFVDTGVSVVAAIIAGVAAWASIRAARRSIATQDRLLGIEETRERDRVRHAQSAKLTARIVKDDSGKGPRLELEIANRGEAKARNVSVHLDGTPILEHEVMLRGYPHIPQPPSEGLTIGPHALIRYALRPTPQARGPFELVLAWSDDSGEAGERRTTLTMP